uniref:Homeobox B5 n=1 Tax=Zonotrichia albicollis TaxID=44394 RepID=A0A8D2QA52_ZONAL
MSSYFVNSFSGRYPNGPDYQLLNYGTGSSMNGSYRDSSTMHSSSYGYNYNGMDLSINRSASSSHFGAVGESSRGFPSPAQESRFRQASSCSLSSPDSLPCSNSESHGGKPAPSPSEPAPAASSTNTNFTELDETSASSGADEGTPISSSIPRAQAEPIATSTAATEGQAPQIFPWMRKLHISHGTAPSFSLLVRFDQNRSYLLLLYFSLRSCLWRLPRGALRVSLCVSGGRFYF